MENRSNMKIEIKEHLKMHIEQSKKDVENGSFVFPELLVESVLEAVNTRLSG